jgi:cation diffusion facilitator CzcD-associated flavoprotein CzcO
MTTCYVLELSEKCDPLRHETIFMPTLPNSPDLQVAIIGAGFAGMAMAIELGRMGISDYVVFEAGDEVGGTWRENTYPGCACDVPSHLYSYSFELNPNWSRAFSPQPEIQDYLKYCAKKHDLYPRIRLNTEITEARFDEAQNYWRLRTGDGQDVTARIVVLGLGPLSYPSIPELDGLDDFEGATFHTARWDHGYDLRGKRVAVVGTGASAIQVVPSIADEVGHLTVFQRTPPWVAPRPDRAFSALEKRLFASVPGWQRLYRSLVYAAQEIRAVGFIGESRVMDLFEWSTRRFIARSIKDPELRRQVTPDYRIGCKRILLSNDYYPALNKPHVDLVPHPVVRFTRDGVVAADGSVHELDAVIFATGFRVTDFAMFFDVLGRGGANLAEVWREGGDAYYGLAAAGFPNLFTLVGPNTGLGHNSIVFMIESQLRLIRQCLEEMNARGATTFEVDADAQQAFNAELQARSKKTVWQSGCKSWYLNEQGKNTTLWPGYTAEFWWRTRQLNRDHFRFA